MTLGCKVAVLGVAVATVGVRDGVAEALRSPWDIHPVAVSREHYGCPSTPALPRDIVAADYYSDEHHSVIDPKRKAAYDEEADKFRNASEDAEKAADRFQKTGSADAAACVMKILLTQANADAMTGTMSTNQANYVQNWTLGGFAVSYLKVRSAGAAALQVSETDTATVQGWLQQVGGQVDDWFSARHAKATSKDGHNNHLYWAGFAAMAAGIAANDRRLYDWGLSTYAEGLHQIAADGTLPLEMDRKALALHYHLFACAPLVMMAEMGEANGRAMYAEEHGKLRLLVARSLSGLIDSKYFDEKAGVPQQPAKDGKIKPSEVIWATPYQRRFPDPMIAELLRKAGTAPYGYLGGLPPA